MVTNIDILTDKIYQEGIMKAQGEAAEIIENAKKSAEKMVKEAHKISSQIVEKANRQASELKQNAISDLKLAGNKALGALKQEIRNLIQQQVLKKPIEHLLADEEFLKELILTTARNYSPESVTVMLPEKIKDKFEKALEGSIKNSLNGMKISFSSSIDGGFQISGHDLNYVVTFTDDDFVEFFKPFLNRKTEEILFKNGI